jgi:hypothetical protein
VNSSGLGATALGDRLCTLPVMSESGSPIVWIVYKHTLKYYQRAREARGKPVNKFLLLEAVEALNAPLVQYQSLPSAGFVKQLLYEAVAEIRDAAAPMPSLFQRDFLNSSSVEKGTPHASKMPIVLLTISEVVEEREDSSWVGCYNPNVGR